MFEAAAAAGVRSARARVVGRRLRARARDRRVDESWPATASATSFYARHKAAAERALDRSRRGIRDMRCVRLRPALIFKRERGHRIRRLFAGPFLPSPLVRPGLIPIVPAADRLVFQAVHSRDVGDAYRLAAPDPQARGAYNVTAEPVLDPATLARLLGARRVRVPARVLRGLADATWRLRLQPTPPGWLDLGRAVPLLDAARAREELGWDAATARRRRAARAARRHPRRSRIADPAARSEASGPARVRELLSGVGARNP